MLGDSMKTRNNSITITVRRKVVHVSDTINQYVIASWLKPTCSVCNNHARCRSARAAGSRGRGGGRDCRGTQPDEAGLGGDIQKLVTPPRSVQRTLTLVQAVLCSRPGDAEADWARISGPLKRDLRGLVAAFPETRL